MIFSYLGILVLQNKNGNQLFNLSNSFKVRALLTWINSNIYKANFFGQFLLYVYICTLYNGT